MKTKNMTTLPLRNSIDRSSLRLGFLLIPLLFCCLALLPKAHAVVPAPDGGYPNNNTAEGTNALFSLTTGVQNTALGGQALFNSTTGNFNTATGAAALFSDTTGSQNTAIGVDALRFNTTGIGHTAIGYRTLYRYAGGNPGCCGNTAIGDSALFSDTTGIANTATGFTAMFNNTTGFNNTANGVAALYHNTTAERNTGIGTNALFSNTTGNNNTAIGDTALFSNTTGSPNTATGAFALANNTSGNRNTANGLDALLSNTTGNNNVAIGTSALRNNTGSSNIGSGNMAGRNLTIGSNNIDIGNEGVAGESTTIRIGTAGTHTATFIAGISGVAVAGSQVVVNSNGRLGVTGSSARFKQGIKPMDKASEAILALKPVTFRYKEEIDPDGIPQFGLIAEEVAKINPDLVGRDQDGKINTVRYEAVNAMLLNEFLKAHRKMQEQEATITQLKSGAAKQEATAAHQQKQIEALTAGLQKVSAQLETSKPAPQVVNNNQ
jgi:trimeric autotransporter adhesin